MLLWPESRLRGLRVYTAMIESCPLQGGRKPLILPFHSFPHTAIPTLGRGCEVSSSRSNVKRQLQVQRTRQAALDEFPETSSLPRLLIRALGGPPRQCLCNSRAQDANERSRDKKGHVASQCRTWKVEVLSPLTCLPICQVR